MNELISQQPVDAMVVAGTVNEPATVTIQGQLAAVTSGNQFRGAAPAVGGTNTLSVTATDPSGNSTTKQYQINNAGTLETFTYDANGNLTSDGTRTLTWDAQFRPLALTDAIGQVWTLQ